MTAASVVYLAVVRYVLPLARYVSGDDDGNNGGDDDDDDTRRRRRHRNRRLLPSLAEGALAWTVVALFGVRYLADYIRMRWRMRVLRSTPDVWWSPHNSGTPLCPLARTRTDLAVTFDERWDRLLDAILVAAAAAGVAQEKAQLSPASSGGGSSTSNHRVLLQTLKGLSDEDWVRLFHSSLEIRRQASYLMHCLAEDAPPDVLDRLLRQKEDCDTAAAVAVGTSPSSTTNKTHREDKTETYFSAVDGDDNDDQAPIGVVTDDRRLLFPVLVPIFQRLWPRFLEFPASVLAAATTTTRTTCDDGPFTLSLIVPMYKERIEDIRRTLDHALHYCGGDPQKIQVVIVHVQPADDENENENDVHHCDNDDAAPDETEAAATTAASRRLERELLGQGRRQRPQQQPSSATTPPFWGALHVVTLPANGGGNGGRGRALNVGMDHALACSRTPVLTFLHADTLVPVGWDVRIADALLLPKKTSGNNCNSGPRRPYFPQACAFTMGIEGVTGGQSTLSYSAPSQAAASSPAAAASPPPLPPGLRGAEWLGVLRCHCGLPYGDSVLSFRTTTLEYIGGFPEQPLMEDYELMDWLRVRSYLLSGPSPSNDYCGEKVVLLPDRIQCSPRRWKAHGVAYTSLVNAICIYRYRTLGVPAEDLFEFYYRPPKSLNGGGATAPPSSSKSKDT